MNTEKEFREYLYNSSSTVDEKGKRYYNVVAAFDVETTKFTSFTGEVANYVYAWSFSIDGVLYRFGRDPKDFFVFLRNLMLTKKLIIYVQWLGYEYNNLTWLFEKYITKGKAENALFKGGNIAEPLQLIQDDGYAVFKCSRALSGKKLEEMGEDIDCPKLKDLDYSVDRNRLTPMTDEEIGYCLRDVEIVCKWVRWLLDSLNEGRTQKLRINNLPLTKSKIFGLYLDKNGLPWHVRHLKAMDQYKNWLDDDYDKFHIAHKGGLIVCNERYLNEFTLDILHADVKSAYPAVQIRKKFPKCFSHVYSRSSLSKQKSMIDDIENWGVLAKFTFKGLLLKKDAPCAIIRELDNIDPVDYTAYMSNIEYKIIEMYYDFDSVVWEDFQATGLEREEEADRKTNLELFAAKESAKGTAAYKVAKIVLNSGYGNKCKRMEVTNIDDDGNRVSFRKDMKDIDYYYPVGVWISAWQRYIMASIIWEIGKYDFIYCNTDSIFCKNNERTKEILNRFNSSFDILGRLGKFETEEVKKIFILGPSRYAIMDYNDSISIVFSGVADEGKTISFSDLITIAAGGNVRIPGATKEYKKGRGAFEGYINGEKVETHDYLWVKSKDINLHKERMLFDLYKEE